MADEDKKLTEEEIQEGIVPSLKEVDISTQVKSCFLDYAMSVIVARAIPDVRDGMKPVHRRIIYSMYESGTTPDKPHKKCARIVGDVMGKYHPHGDAAIYGAVVRLAQPFAMRNVLIDGHGNFGSIDGDEAAAYRYTEARLDKLALQLVRDIDCDVVDFMDNYDGVDQEPTVLPSRFPNLLVNGSSGIAVGMATNIPTHNLGEVIDATIAIAHNPNLTTLEIMQYLPGPDFPTGCIILGRQGIKDAYDTGTGSIVVRSKCVIEKHNEKEKIVVEEVPYGVNKAKLIENIADLVKNKQIEGITGIHDESNKEGIRITIDIRHDAIADVVLNNLYKLTQLQTSFGVIFLCLENGAPKVLGINRILNDYVEHQVNVVTRRTKFLLKKDEDRKIILNGLFVAINNIDEIVKIIKGSKSTEIAKQELMNRFNLVEVQAQTILDMPLRRLTGLELDKLKQEYAEIEERIKRYLHILSSRETVIEVIVNELEEIKAKFADKRRTEITDYSGDIDDETLIPQQDIVAVITQNGYIKRMTSDTFKTQNRGGRGIKGAAVNNDDLIKLLLHTNTHTDLLFFSNKGKVYTLRGYKIPEGSRTSKGLPVQNLLNLEKDERIMSIIDLKNRHEQTGYLCFFTKNGLIKKTKVEEYLNIRTNGKIAINLKDGDQLLDVKHTDGNAIIGITATNGKLVSFNENTVRDIGRTAAGVKGMNTDGAVVASATTSMEGNIILTITQNGYGKMTKSEDYRLTKRGAKGVSTLKTTSKTGKLVASIAVNGDEDLMVITSGGIIIRIPINQIRIMSRLTQGVRIIRLEDKQKVSSVTVIPHALHDDETEMDEISDEAKVGAAEGPIDEELAKEDAQPQEEVVNEDDNKEE